MKISFFELEDWQEQAARSELKGHELRFFKEPLTKDSELWDLPNVIASSHTAPYVERHIGMLVDLFCENLKRYLKGEALLHRVDKAIGY